SQLATLNGAGDNASANATNAQPVGDTPTARAFSEAARYMMGMQPLYGVSSYGGQNSVCAAEEEVETNCRDEIIYGDPITVDWCDITSNQYECSRGNWQDLRDWQTCDINSEDCQTRTGRGDWTNWSRNNECNYSSSWC